ncbi:MAG: ABC transporter substrate-binding protein [Acidobacteria bacterium]|nr:ABC transporter substrate-binding protein [Acidobacteriota bacterium]
MHRRGLRSRTVRRAVPALLAIALATTACGTRVDREEFYRSLASQPGTGQAPGQQPGGAAPGGETPVSGVPGGPTQVPGGSLPTSTAAPTTTGSPTGSGSGSFSNVSSAVIGNTIRIGFHLPETGAAPLPTDYRDTINAVTEYFNAEQRPHGRTIEFIVADDGYDAQKGLAACKKIAGSNPLLAVGHTMPAAQDACARLFGERGIPYFMRGTYPEILRNRSLSWFGTVSDDRQGRMLAEYVLKRLGGVGRKSAVVFQNDQVSARDNFVATIKAGGGKIAAVEESVPRQPDYAATVQKLMDAGAEYVLLSMPPVDAIKLSVQAQGQGYHPQWLGGGTWWNYNMVLESAGMALDGAIVLSPWPSIDSAGADEFKRVYKKYRPDKEPDDIGLVMWGWTNLIHEALAKAGPNLSRRALAQALQTFRFNKPYWLPIAYTPSDHIGADSVAVFRADGQARRWRQISGFTSGF